MTEFFEKWKDVIAEKAKVVTKKTGEVVEVVADKTEQTLEVQRIKSQIHVMERNNERDFKDIGKMVYDKFKKGEEVDSGYVELCEAIAARESNIAKSKEEIAKVKGLDTCPNCEAHLEVGTKYCPKCGTEVE